MHISGENPLDDTIKDDSYYFSTIPHIWGWASWRRAWNLYNVEFQDFEKFITQNAISNVFDSKEAQKYWNKTFTRVYEGKINTWDYQWTYALFVNNALSVVPNKNLVSNIGFGHQNACHTAENALCANRKTYEIEKIKHPDFIVPNKKNIQNILKVRYDIHKKTIPFMIKREITRIFKKLQK